MARAVSLHFGCPAEAAPSPPPGGTKGAADRRRAGDGALVARPGPGSALKPVGRRKRRQKWPPSSENGPPVAGWPMARSLPPPGGSGPPPRRRRSSGSATRPRVRANARGSRKPWRKSPPSSERKARRRGNDNRGARCLPAASAARPKRPAEPAGGSRVACLCDRSGPRKAPRPRRACGSPLGVAPAGEERAPPQAAGAERTLASRPPRRGAAGVPLRRRRRDGGPAPPPRGVHAGAGSCPAPWTALPSASARPPSAMRRSSFACPLWGGPRQRRRRRQK